MFYFLRLFFGIVTICLVVSFTIQYFLAESTYNSGGNVSSRMGMMLAQDMIQTRDTYSGLLLAGTAAQNNRDWESARQFFNQLSEQFTTGSSNMLRSMTLSLTSGDYDDAVAIARKIQDQFLTGDKDEAKAEQFDLARLLLISNALKDNNVDHAQKYIDELTDGAIASFIKPVVDIWMDAYSEPDKINAKTKDLGTIQIFYKALAADFANKPVIATQLFDKLSMRTLTAQTIETIAAFYVRNDNVDKAIKILKAGAKKYPKNNHIPEFLSQLKTNDAEYNAPSFTTIHLSGTASGLAIAFADFARLLASETAFDSALIFARFATYMDPNLPGIKMVIGDILGLQGQSDRALTAYQSVSIDDPDFIAAQIEIAEILNDQNKVSEAIKVVVQAVENQKSLIDENTYLTLGNLYKSDNQFEKAINAYDIAEAMALEHATGKRPEWLWFLYYFRGVSFDMLEQYDVAETDLKRALDIQPENATVLNYLGYTYADNGENLEAAYDMIKRAVDQKPDDAYIVDSMGWVLYRMERYDEAVEYLERAAALRPYNSVINDHLGDAYWKVGRRLEAKYMWQRAVDYIPDNDIIGLDADDEEQINAAKQASHKLENGLD